MTAETRLVVLVDPALNGDQLAVIRMAITRTGAQAIDVHIDPDRCFANEPLNAAVDTSDLIITTGTHTASFLDADVPTLHLHSVPPQLFAPHASLKRRVHALARSLDDAGTLAISDTNGTDLTMSLSGSTTRFDHGFLDADQPRASFPAGWVRVMPAAGTVQGQLVLMPGDANLSANRLIDSPVVLRIIDDHISEIEGHSPDADVIRALLEHPGESTAYGVARVSIGMNPGSVASGLFDPRLLDPVVSQLLAGVVHLSFGDNLVADRPCHQTITVAVRTIAMCISTHFLSCETACSKATSPPTCTNSEAHFLGQGPTWIAHPGPYPSRADQAECLDSRKRPAKLSYPPVTVDDMTVLDLDPPQPALRLVSSNGPAPARDSRYRSTTPLYGDARELFQQVLQYALEHRVTIDPDSLRMVLGTKQAMTAVPARAFTAAGIWQLMFVDVVASCRTRKLDVPPGCASALIRTIEYLDSSNSFHKTSDSVGDLYDAVDECTGGWVDDLHPTTPPRARRSLRSGRGTKRT